MLLEASSVADPAEIRQQRWPGLADSGFLLLESRDHRQHVDCRHLGRVLDRLGSAYPRCWVRACQRHEHCTLQNVGPDDQAYAPLQAALARLAQLAVIACVECADDEPEG